MVASLDQQLIALASAVDADGGAGVLRVLRDILLRHAPYEAAEVALLQPAGFDRFTLTDDERPLAAEDLLLDVDARPELRRFDDPEAIGVFRRTGELAEERGIKSLLVLPLSQAGGGPGALVLGRSHPYGFVGVSLRVLVPVAAMAGLALSWARTLERAARKGGLLLPPPMVRRPESPLAESPQDAPIVAEGLASSGSTADEARAAAAPAELLDEIARGQARIEALTAERDEARAERDALRAGGGRRGRRRR